MNDIAIDEAGHPILLGGQGNRPGAAVGTVGEQIGVRGGNPYRIPAGQPGAGRVASKPGVGEVVRQRGTAGVASDELARRFDAVREAAREFESFDVQDVADWLKGKLTRPFTKADLDQFLADVRSQQITDLVDALDDSERGSLRGRRRVRVVMPKGYRRLTLNRLEDAELQQLFGRLKARGWNFNQLKGLRGKLPKEKQSSVEGLA